MVHTHFILKLSSSMWQSSKIVHKQREGYVGHVWFAHLKLECLQQAVKIGSYANETGK